MLIPPLPPGSTGSSAGPTREADIGQDISTKPRSSKTQKAATEHSGNQCWILCHPLDLSSFPHYFLAQQGVKKQCRTQLGARVTKESVLDPALLSGSVSTSLPLPGSVQIPSVLWLTFIHTVPWPLAKPGRIRGIRAETGSSSGPSMQPETSEGPSKEPPRSSACGVGGGAGTWVRGCKGPGSGCLTPCHLPPPSPPLALLLLLSLPEQWGQQDTNLKITLQ